MYYYPRTIEAFAIDRVKDHVIPEQPAGCPIPAEALRQLLENCPVVLIDPEADPDSDFGLPFNSAVPEQFGQPSRVLLSQVTAMHKRSFEVLGDDVPERWQDEFGNHYTGLSLKGINLSVPSIMKHPTASEGFIAYGLQESSIIERVLETSQTLRQLGIATEHIIGVSELKSYPWPKFGSTTDAHELIGLKEYKRRLVTAYWQQLPAEQQTVSELGVLHEKFKDMTFYVSLRATDSPYRLNDLHNDEVRANHFEYVNKNVIKDGDEPLDPTVVADRSRYIMEYVTPAIGINLARLHAAKLGHKFPHIGNITALGGLVDLDSVYGEPLGMNDEPLDISGRCIDLVEIIGALDSAMPYTDLTNPTEGPTLVLLQSYHDELLRLSGSAAEADLVITLHELAMTLDSKNDPLDFSKFTIGQAIRDRFDVNRRHEQSLKELPGWSAAIEEWMSYANEFEIINNDGLMEILEQHFAVAIEVYGLMIVTDTLSRINTADADGEPVRPYQFYTDPSDAGAIGRTISETYSAMREDIDLYICAGLRRRFDTIIAKHISAEDKPSAATIDNYVLQAYELLQIGKRDPRVTEVIEHFLEQFAPQLEAASDVKIYPSILGKPETTWLNAPAQSNVMWRLTDGVTFDELIKGVTPSDRSKILSSITFGRRCETEVTLDKPSILIEVVSDAEFDGNSVDESHDKPIIKIDFTSKPSYILQVYVQPDGSRHYVLNVTDPVAHSSAKPNPVAADPLQPALF